MQWDAANKKWVKEIKHKDAIQEHKIVKIDKEQPFIKWGSFTILWGLNMNKKLSTRFNLI